jgi:PqqD family protein of HPr-rel-A system
MTASNRYRPEPESAIVVRPLDDIILLYHRPSGQTHMVVSPVPEILAALHVEGEGDARAVHDRMAQSYDLGEREAALVVLSGHLEEMAQLGLVRRL